MPSESELLDPAFALANYIIQFWLCFVLYVVISITTASNFLLNHFYMVYDELLQVVSLMK